MNGRVLPLQAVMPTQASPELNKMQDNKSDGASFSKLLKSALEKVNETQLESDKKTEMLVNGKIDDLHDVMISAQKASLTIEATIQVQQKVIDTYNEVMRMQI